MARALPSHVGRKLMRFFDEYSLNLCNMGIDARGPLNTFKGGVGSSTIDYLAIPTSLLKDVRSCEVLDDPILNTSDHRAVQVIMNFSCISTFTPRIEGGQSVRWNKISRDTLTSDYSIPTGDFCLSMLETCNISSMNPHDLDNLIDCITTKLVEVGNTLPKAKFKSHVRPFWNNTLNDLKREKVIAYRKWKGMGSNRDPTDISYVNHKRAKRDFRRELKKVRRDIEKKQVQELVSSAECGGNKFWKLVKQSRQTKQSSTLSIKDRQGRVMHNVGEVV